MTDQLPVSDSGGKYCPEEGLTEAILDCEAGYYCPEGSSKGKQKVTWRSLRFEN